MKNKLLGKLIGKLIESVETLESSEKKMCFKNH